MKERPILFSAPMIRALLDGRKTMTRRVVKDIPIHMDAERFGSGIGNAWDCQRRVWIVGDTQAYEEQQRALGRRPNQINGAFIEHFHPLQCPYGKPGDRLWVRERHAFVADGFMALRAGVVYADGTTIMHGDAPQLIGQTVYNSDKPEVWKWRPSIHMPRWASRILLEVTDVRVERVQEISDSDVFSEGLRGVQEIDTDRYPANLQGAFASLWDSINAGRGYGWETNCWVWVVSFRRVDA